MSDPEQKPAAAVPVKELTGRIGKYDILRPLGKGAMGMVYLAHDTILERDVALKVMVAQIADDPELKQRFEREAKAVARMTHPNVVNVFDLGSHSDGSPFIAMELLRGQDLQKAMRKGAPIPLERRVAIIIQVLTGLAHAHQAGIVHRDIKPANIFLNDDGTVKIMDFGVARLTTASMTGTGNIVGTADYMSPEQVKGAKVDGRSDLFSVGCMLYELLAGVRPFHAENLMAIFYKITHDAPDFGLIPGGPEFEALVPIVQKALAKDLAERYQSAYDFAIDLREYLKSSTSASGMHALDQLLDMEPPASSPAGEGAVPTILSAEAGELVPGTMGAPRTVTPAHAPTVQGRSGPKGTVIVGQPPTLSADARTKVERSARPAPPRVPRPVPASGNPVLYAVVGGLLVALLAAGGYIYVNRQTPPSPAPPTTEAAASPSSTLPTPTTLAAATPVPTPPLATTAPQPRFGEPKGKGATALRAALAAYKQGDYEGALRSAQVALHEDPGNADARRLAENALNGQKASVFFTAAEAALRKGDLVAAASQAEAGRSLAPGDARGPALLGRIHEAEQAENLAQQQKQQQAQQQKQQQQGTQVATLLAQAEGAFGAQKYEAAISLYDEVLKLDPANQRAGIGKANALGAKALAQAASGNIKAAHSFVPGKTTAQSAETVVGNVPPGFEESAGVTVKKGSQAADLAGKIQFDVEPDAVKAGEKYTVSIYLANEGSAPIQVTDMIVTTTINGQKRSGPVPPQARDVAPRQKALLLATPDFWKDDTSAWAMEVVVRTARGETYKNQLSWR
jgi:serine/threonine protein kinase